MSTEEQKPVVATETPAVVEPTPAADKPVEATEPKTEEAPKTEPEATPAAPVEETKAEEKKEETVEPITSGALGYKAPGLKNAFRFSKKYFWFGEEPVSTKSLETYLRGEKAEVAHPTAAWSSQTGKGLLYFVKHADQKETPAGVLPLYDATDLSKDGTVAFFFKLHGHKHTFEAQTASERNGWFVALEKAIEEAKGLKETIPASEGYKEEHSKLSKPTTLAAATASAPKKSTDATPKPAETETPVAEGSTPARAGSSSSSSSDEEKKKKKASKSKSRSVSRGKRSSIFGTFLNKKEKVEEKVEEKKEEKEAKKEEKEAEKKTEETPAAPATESSTAAPVIPPVDTLPAATEESKPEEPAAPVAEEKKAEEKPKPAKRGSIFGNFAQKLKSPTHEKKESDVVPAAPAKEAEAPKEETPKIEEPAAAEPVAPVTDSTAEAPKEESKPTATTPAKEKQHFSFGKFLGGAKEKVRSPSGEKAPEAPKTEEAPKVEEPAKTEETPAPVAATEPAVEAPKEEEKKDEKKDETPATTTPKEKGKRTSIFGNITGSIRKATSKPKKEKEASAAPAKVEETPEPKEETTEAPKVEDKKEETPAASTEPAAIGDVVPDAVTVGQAPKSTPQVSTTA